MKDKIIVNTHNQNETELLAGWIARICNPGTIIALDGELGAGKTTFTRGFAKGIGLSPETVSSPTFTIAQEYGPNADGKYLYHLDVYRLGGSEDFYESGFTEYLNKKDYVLIEWANLVKEVLPDNSWEIHLSNLNENIANPLDTDLSKCVSYRRKIEIEAPKEYITILKQTVEEKGGLHAHISN